MLTTDFSGIFSQLRMGVATMGMCSDWCARSGRMADSVAGATEPEAKATGMEIIASEAGIH
jgi:hypothetical protein